MRLGNRGDLSHLVARGNACRRRFEGESDKLSLFVVLTAPCRAVRFRTNIRRERVVAKTAAEITQKVEEIYALVSNSTTPISALSMQSTILAGKEDWLPAEVERVSSEVMGLLIRHGWKRPSE
jgi:hypothetical protein